MEDKKVKPLRNKNSFGYRMYDLRTKQKMGQKELATYLHVSISTISNYENNIHEPDLPTLIKIADYLNTSADYLLGRTSCLYPMSYLEQNLISNYSCSDIINTVIQLSNSSRTDLIGYLDMLNLRDRSKGLSSTTGRQNKPKKK